MRAAVIEAFGRPPVVREVAEPRREAGQALIEVGAAPLNPVDLSIAAGRFYVQASEVPYIAGKEGLGRVLEGEAVAAGTRVWFPMPGGLGGPGSFSERAAASEDQAVPVPDGVDDAVAACLGVAGLAAWLPLEWRARLREGERVLVLGASGAVGQIAVQAAKLLGAGRVVAAARDGDGLRRAGELGADAVVRIRESQTPEELAAEIREAASGDIEVTIDPLWGEPVVAAAHAAAPEGRIVHVGQSAGTETRLPSAPVRGKLLSILGHANARAPREVAAGAYRRMARHAAEGRLQVDHEVMPLERAAEAWRRQESFPRRKIVLRP